MSSLYRRQIVFEERSSPDETTPLACPLIASSQADINDRFIARLAYEYGDWSEIITPEQTAYALAQVSAATILPPLTRLTNGYELLDYRVRLREVMDDELVAEIVSMLDQSDPEGFWQQVDASGYACVIGAGVAAYIDTTRGDETLSLRYANALVPVMLRAHGAAELPRSRLFLQTTLYERFDALLARVRTSAWFWLAR